MLKGHGLEKLIQKKKHVVNRKKALVVTSEDNSKDFDAKDNCKLENWEKQDQLLLGWLRSAIFWHGPRHVIGFSTTFNSWSTLEMQYALQS